MSDDNQQNKTDQDKISDIEKQVQELEGEVESLGASENSESVDSTSTTESQEDDLAVQLESAQAEIAQLKDAYLRAKAEEDNVRRRSEKEVANGRKFAVESFAKELLNVRDSLKLASSVEMDEQADEAVKSINEGVQITLKQLDSVFERFSIQVIETKVGGKLDPSFHQAMSQVESDEVEKGCIVSVIQDGFQLHDRLLRPAMVIVAK